MNRSLSSVLSRPLSIRSFSSFAPSSSSSSSSFIHSYSSSIRSTSLSSSPLSSSGSLLTGSSSLSSIFPSPLSSSNLSSAFSFAALSLYQISIRPASKIESGQAGQIKYDSAGKRLGIKIFGGARAKPGSIIARQRGTKYHPGWNVGLGRDHTIYSLVEGRVHFTRLRRWFRKQRRVWTFINVLPYNGSIDELERDFNARQEKLDLLYNWKKQNIKPLTDVKQKQLQKRKIQVEKWRESQDSTLQKMLQEIDAASSSPSSSEQQTAAAATN